MSYAYTVLSDTPLAYYRLDDLAGSSTAADSSGNGRTGTVTGGVTFGAAGALMSDSGTSATFDGTSGYISLPTTGLPTGNSPWSLEAWVNFTAYPTNDPGLFLQFGAWGTPYAVASLGTRTTDTIALSVFYQDVISPQAVTLGVWHYVVGTYDGTTLRLYIDGSLVQSAAANQALALTASKASIGGVPGFANWYPGRVDEVALYTYTLSPTQITNHYTTGVTYLGALSLSTTDASLAVLSLTDAALATLTITDQRGV